MDRKIRKMYGDNHPMQQGQLQGQVQMQESAQQPNKPQKTYQPALPQGKM